MNEPEQTPHSSNEPGSDPGSDPNSEQPIEVLEPPRRIPNMGHALLFLALAGVLLILFQLVLLIGKHPVQPRGNAALTVSPKLLLASMAGTYLSALFASSWLFSRLWRRSFLSGVQWRWSAARSQMLRLVPLGFALAIIAQGALYYLTPPKSMPIEEMFASASDAWLITAFGTLVAPLFEEICFRGFLVPAFAIAYDWVSLPRTPEAHARWRAGASLSPLALIFSAIVSSLLFALIHGHQVGYLVPVIVVLFSVSLVLTFVRIKTGSVACSTVVHAAYNSFVFLVALIQTGGYRHLERLKS